MSRSLCTICLRFKLRALMMDGVGMVGKDADVWLLIKSICWNSLLSAHWSRLFTHWQTRSHLRFTKSKRNCKSQTLNQIYTKGRVGVGWGGLGDGEWELRTGRVRGEGRWMGDRKFFLGLASFFSSSTMRESQLSVAIVQVGWMLAGTHRRTELS